MSQKACPTCHLITKRNRCSNCNSSPLSDDFSGLVIVIRPQSSTIAKALNIQKKGRYALRVR